MSTRMEQLIKEKKQAIEELAKVQLQTKQARDSQDVAERKL